MTIQKNQANEKQRKWLFLTTAVLLLVFAVFLNPTIQAEGTNTTEPIAMKEEDAAAKAAPSIIAQETEETKNIAEVVTEINSVEIVETTEAPIIIPASTENTTINEGITSAPSETQKPGINSSYVGQFKIPSLGINVGCYNGSSQKTVDNANSAAYFNNSGHMVIADHVNQDFNSLKSCKQGDIAYVPVGGDSLKYECVAVMDGINTGYSLTTPDGRNISELYPGTVVCYTCNGNSTNVTMAFFKIVETNNSVNHAISQIENQLYNQPKTETEEVWLNPSPSGKEPCPANTHKWYLFHSLEFWETEGEYRVKYFHEQYVCSTCESDMLKTTEIERVQIQEEPTLPPETEPPVSEPETTNPKLAETEPSESIEPIEPETTLPEETQPEPQPDAGLNDTDTIIPEDSSEDIDAS